MPLVRFAPSPNGPLHLGHAYSVLRNAQVAARLGADVRLRLEDIDTQRCTPPLAAAVLDDLAWLGFAWTGPVLRQSARFAAYAEALERLARRGLLFACFCTRGDVARAIEGRIGWPRDPDGSPLYPGTCRHLGGRVRAARVAQGVPHALRLDSARAMATLAAPLDWLEYGEGTTARRIVAEPAAWGDAVLRRKDIPASYHVAVTLDDSEQGVTDVVRGADLHAATSLHRLLQHLLGWTAPRYHHHRLVRGDVGQKLSKSEGARALATLRADGISPADVRALLDTMMGDPDG